MMRIMARRMKAVLPVDAGRPTLGAAHMQLAGPEIDVIPAQGDKLAELGSSTTNRDETNRLAVRSLPPDLRQP